MDVEKTPGAEKHLLDAEKVPDAGKHLFNAGKIHSPDSSAESQLKLTKRVHTPPFNLSFSIFQNCISESAVIDQITHCCNCIGYPENLSLLFSQDRETFRFCAYLSVARVISRLIGKVDIRLSWSPSPCQLTAELSL